MSNKIAEKILAQTFMEIADRLENGDNFNTPKIAVTGIGSEHGEQNVLDGALAAKKMGIDVTYIGMLTSDEVKTVSASTADEAQNAMEKLLETKEVDGVVTMHYPFPIEVATVGRAVTPGRGRQMYIGTTTGTSAIERVNAMVKNAVYSIICAKSCGVKSPTVGILNIEGARQVEIALRQLKSNGYDLDFAQSARSDKGCIMRGNDLLSGQCDIMVCDSLTGNILMKTLSSFTTGGSYESIGSGYGPGIGKDYDKLITIVSRASGSPVIAGAIEYAAQLVKGDYLSIAKKEIAKAEKAGLNEILGNIKSKAKVSDNETFEMPKKEVVTYQISGIEIMDLEDAVTSLLKDGIYAESGMGCTGPIVLVSEVNGQKAEETLRINDWIA